MRITCRHSLAIALLLVGVSSVAALALPSFSDRNIAAGNLNPTDTILVQEIRVTRSAGEDVTLAAITIRNLGTADSSDIAKIIIKDGGDVLGELDNLSGIDSVNGVTINLGGYHLDGTTHYLKIYVTVSTTVSSGETVQLQSLIDYVRNGTPGSSTWISDLTGETIRNGGFDETGDSSPDAGYLNPDDEAIVQIATFNDNDANGSAVRWVQTGPQTIVRIENLGSATPDDIAQVRVTLTIGGNDYVWGWGVWNPASPMTFEHNDFAGPGGAADNPPEIADNGGVTVKVEMRVGPEGDVTDGRTIRTKTTLLVRERGEGDDGEDVEYEQAVTSGTTQTVRKQGFERIEDESESLASGIAATDDVVVQSVRAYDDDSNNFDVQARRVYIRNSGTADGDEIKKIVVKAGATTILTLDSAEIVNFKTGAWYPLDQNFTVDDDENQVFNFYYTIGTPDDGHTFRPAVRIEGRENGTDYPSDEVVYPDTLGLYEPGFEFVENMTPPEGGTAYSGQRLLAQRIRLEDRDEDDDDVAIDPVVVKNIGTASGNPDITKIEVWRQDEEGGPEVKIGEETDLAGLRTGGIRVDITNDNIVQDQPGGAVTYLLIYLQIAEPEEMVAGRTIQLQTRVLHTERHGTYDKEADSNQWVLETNHRPVPDFTFEKAENGAAAVGPKADFTYEDTIQFHGTATDPDGDDIIAWHWDFGDGETSDEQNPTHQYPNGGTFNVTLTVTDARGVTGSVTKTIEVEGPPNQPPTIDAINADPANPAVNQDVEFSAEITDPDQPAGTPFEYEWDFGDGATSTIANPKHSFAEKKAYTVTLTVTDAQGAQATATKTISVGNEPPVADFTWTPATPNTGEDVKFTDTSTDPDATDTIEAWAWNFGDGTTSTLQNPVHIYAGPGTYTVTLVVTDSRGGESPPTTKEITVEGPVRVIVFAYPNPASTTATIVYALPDGATDPVLRIYDLSGRLVRKEDLAAGETTYRWDLRDDAGDPLPNGLYFCIVSAKNAKGRTVRSDVFRLLIAR